MIIGKILNPDIPLNDTHLETRWEISTQEDFAQTAKLVDESTTDPLKLTLNVFQINPVPGTKYYGRARLRTEKCGWGDWENMDIIEVGSIEELNAIYILPSRISIPRVNTKKFDPNTSNMVLLPDELKPEDHPVIDFAICCDGYESLTNAPHVATSWYIEDINKRVIWKSELDKVNLTSIKVLDIVLEHNQVYRARAVFHSSTNDVSDGGCFLFRTCKEVNTALRVFLESSILRRPNNRWNERMEFSLPFDTGVTKFMLTILKYNSYGYETIMRSTVEYTNPNWIIPANTLADDSFYLIKFRSVQMVADPAHPDQLIEDSDDNWEVIYFSTFDSQAATIQP